MVTQEIVEKAVCKYILEEGGRPRYVLIDEKSANMFNNSFKAEICSKKQSDDPVLISKMSVCSYGAVVDVEVLIVKTDKTLFEVVG